MALGANEEYLRCPICHSPIGVHNTTTGTDRNLTDEEIEDLESQGVYIWTHDPIQTRRGLAGDDYIGLNDIKITHIQELQEARQQQEIEAGIEEINRTDFTTINSKDDIKKKHIRELRQSTEKILGITDSTTEAERQALLENYFNYDEEGNYLGTKEYGISKSDKTEWKRINNSNIPYMPNEVTNIYALDIEELRCPIGIGGWFDDFTDLSVDDIVTKSASVNLHITGSPASQQVDIDNQYVNNYLSDYRNNYIYNTIQAYTYDKVNEIEAGYPAGVFCYANSNSNITVTRHKPLHIVASASASGGSSQSSFTSQARAYCNLLWYNGHWQNPDTININENAKLYIDLTGTWSNTPLYTHVFPSISSEGKPTISLGVSFLNVTKSQATNWYYQLKPSTTTPYIDGWKADKTYYYQTIAQGKNYFNLWDNLLEKQPTWEVGDEIKLQHLYLYIHLDCDIISSGFFYPYYPGGLSNDTSASMDIILNKIGITKT